MIIDYFVPKALRGGEAATLERARLLILFALSGEALMLGFSLWYLSVSESHGPTILLGCCAVGVVLVLFLLKTTGSSRLAAHGLALMLFLLIGGLSVLRGFEIAILVFGLLVPLCAVFIADLRASLVWAGAFILLFIAIHMLDGVGAIPMAVTLTESADKQGDLLALVGITLLTMGAVAVYDVTRKRALARQAEFLRQLKWTHRLEGLGRLAGGVAHDFNNLLSVILANGELVRDQLGDNAAAVRDVDEIIAAARRGAELTKRLRAFSQSEVLERTELDMAAVVQGTEEPIRRLLPENIHVDVRTSDGLWHVQADRGQLEVVLLNLAANAHDAMPHGGRLDIECDNFELTVQGAPEHLDLVPGRYLRLAVRDNGLGMTSKVRERIFEPFFTTKDPGRGLGLGLSVAISVIQRLGGRIEADSSPGNGTTITIYLPAFDGAESTKTEKPRSVRPDRVRPRTILLVEDEPAVRRAVRRLLIRGGHHVREAESGPEALELCSDYDGPIDLVLTDVVMPHMSGPELADKLRDKYPDARFIFMSGYASDAFNSRDPGVEGELIHKPFDLNDILQLISRVLDDDGPAAGRDG